MAASVSAATPGVDADERVAMGAWPTLKPALSPSVELNITIVYTAIYALLFLFVYAQLWMIWYYRHKRFSYQTVFLFCCLVWSGLRTTLFSFYYKDCDLANDLPMLLYWLLYCFPVCLQFTMLCLLVLFFAQVVFKARAKYEPSKYKKPLRFVIVGAVLIFLASNLACAVAVRLHEKKYQSIPMYLSYVRVAVNDSLFVIFAIALSVCMVRMTKMSSSSLVLEAKVDAVKNLSESFAYVSFGIVLFVWEVLPISVVVIFFRVKRQSSAVAMTDFSSSSHGSKVFFFDNPRRYESDDDLSAVDGRSRSPDDTGSYSINRSGSRRGTPSSTPQGTPVRGSQRSSLLGIPRIASYGAMFSGGTPGSRGPSPLLGSLPARATMSSAAVASRHGADMSNTTAVSAHHASISPSDSVMTPPPYAIMNRPPEMQGQRLRQSYSRDSLQRSQDAMPGGKLV